MDHPVQHPSIELFFPSELGYEKVARETIAAFARRLGFEPDQIEDLKTALGEACVNAIEHGNQQVPGMQVAVNCRCEDQRLLVEICDQGVARYQSSGPPASIEHKVLGLAPARGMGLLMITQLVDEAGFSDHPGGGNRFWFAMRLRPVARQPTGDTCVAPRAKLPVVNEHTLHPNS